jgi:hypothetical protein
MNADETPRPDDQAGRRPTTLALAGKLLVASALLVFCAAAAFWFGVFPVAAEMRGYIALALALSGAADLFFAFRFLARS